MFFFVKTSTTLCFVYLEVHYNVHTLSDTYLNNMYLCLSYKCLYIIVQVCYVQTYTKSLHTIRYRSGCVDKLVRAFNNGNSDK